MSPDPVQLDFSKAQPIQGPPQPQPNGGVQLDFSKAQPVQGAAAPNQPSTPQPTQPAAPQTPTTPPDFDPLQIGRGSDEIKGFVKGGMKTLAGMIEAAGMPIIPSLAVNPPTGPESTEPHAKKFADWLRAHAQINNPDQERGNFVESASEFLPFMEEQAGEAGANVMGKYATQAELAKFAQKYPKIAALWNSAMVQAARSIGGTAVRSGLEQGGQTALKSGFDEKATKESAEVGAAAGGVLSMAGKAIPSLYRSGREAVSDAIEGMRPGTRTVAGADFATQPGTAKPVLRNLEDVQQDSATQAVDEALGKIGKTGVANSVNRTNAMRAPEGEIIPPARRLPGRGGFTVGPADEPTVERTGSSARPANMRVQQTGTRVVEKPEGTYDPTRPGASGRKEPIMRVRQYANDSPPEGTPPTWVATGGAPPEGAEGPEEYGGGRQAVRGTEPAPAPAGETVSGPGTMILTDDGQALGVERARQQLAQYDRILNDPAEVGEMGVRQHAAVQAARDDRADQLGRFDNFAAAQPHFPEHNALEMVRNTDSLGDAGEQLKAAHAPFWKTADEASGNQWTALREREKWIRNKLNSPNPIGNYDDLQKELNQNQADQMAFFDKYRTTVAPHDWERARSGYQDGIVLSNLDDFLQQKFNGIDQQLEQRGIASGNKRIRVFQPDADFNKQLEKFYSGGIGDADTNRQVLQRTIGQDHMDALHDLGIMFNSTERMEQAQSLRKSVLTAIHHHYYGVRGILAGGGGLMSLGAHEAGTAAGIGSLPALTGTAAGVRRYVTERLITDPDFLKVFNYAVKNNVSSRTAGPLLASRLIAQGINEYRKGPDKPTIQDKEVVPANPQRGVQSVTLPTVQKQ